MQTFLVRSLVCAIALGTVGFLCGYFGPLTLNPDANTGPLLGTFFTGPSAFALGIVIGAVSAALSLTHRAFLALLAAAAATTTIVTLYLSLPGDRYQGVVIDAEIRGCKSPTLFVSQAMARWDKWNAETTWRTPRPGWKSEIPRMLERDRGVVLSMVVHRRWEIYEQRKPWNRGRLHATLSKNTAVENYFARGSSGSCSQFKSGDRAIYSPEWEASIVSPPDVLPTLLGFYVLKPIPPRFSTLVSRKSAG